MGDIRHKLWSTDANALLRALLRLRSLGEARHFIRDLLTAGEIRMIVDRWRVARLLHNGRSYREIEARTGLSSRTIARISHWLNEGEGGYRAMLARIEGRGA